MAEERPSNNSRYGEELMEIDNMSGEALVTDHDRRADELDALEEFLNRQYERMFEAGSFSGGETLFGGVQPSSDNSMSLSGPGENMHYDPQTRTIDPAILSDTTMTHPPGAAEFHQTPSTDIPMPHTDLNPPDANVAGSPASAKSLNSEDTITSNDPRIASRGTETSPPGDPRNEISNFRVPAPGVGPITMGEEYAAKGVLAQIAERLLAGNIVSDDEQLNLRHFREEFVLAVDNTFLNNEGVRVALIAEHYIRLKEAVHLGISEELLKDMVEC
ncbi:hypothetical protein LTR70_007630 [Exophiala xenobiotica]|uniref:Uncharacterized protein n=1 Tax=Lithohypha guttulata TaxID=1690604 RepID=A0ABR0K3R9_9EURO|nr:hypothetical protein LTR24_007162 [Lithohypha guttulata]KAK5313444.1 hypothetical protein LTR70_007630 [Exophiala xenobiotica]